MDDATSNAAPPDGDLEYTYKPSLMGAPCEFRLTADALHWNVGRGQGRIPYGSIRRIRLSFRPVTLATYRFVAEIWSDGAPKLIIASTSWRSVVEQQRQDAAYAAFVRALNHRVAAAGGATAFQAGSPHLLYWPGVLVFAAFALAIPFMAIRAVHDGALGGAAIVAALLLVFLWQVGTFFWRNRPGPYRPDAVPSLVLPRG